MDLTMCGLLVERAEELARLYAEHGNWNDVKERWSTNDYRTEAHGQLPEDLPCANVTFQKRSHGPPEPKRSANDIRRVPDNAR